MPRGIDKLKPAEAWALDLIRPGLEKACPEGYDIIVPENDPPDCIAISKKDNRKRTAIEFSALGPPELFEFYNAGLKRDPPYISRISIPYEPEFWMEELLRKKKFVSDKRYDVLCTHFCSHFAMPDWPKPKQNAKKHQQIIPLTLDMVERFQNVVWNKGLNDEKTVLFVRPETKTLNLSLPTKPNPTKEIDVSDGYPTIQLIATNVPMGEMIDYSKIPQYDLVIRPKNPAWNKPDKFRIPTPKAKRLFVKNEESGEEVPGVFCMQVIGPDMPMIKYL